MRMRISFITSLIIAVFAVVFALQNTEVVIIDFLFWGFESSLALVLLLTFLIGALCGFLVVLSSQIRTALRSREEDASDTAQDTSGSQPKDVPEHTST